jgi:hypothetical protein
LEIEADVYIMADGNGTYEHLQAPELIWMMLHRTRHLFVRQRTIPINALGAHLRHCDQRHLQSTSNPISRAIWNTAIATKIILDY